MNGASGIGLASAADALGETASLLALGGPIVAVLIAMSVFALAIVIVKLWQYARIGGGEATAAAIAANCRAGRVGAALSAAERGRGPAAPALSFALRGRARGAPQARLREEAATRAADALDGLRDWLRPLEVIASLAPLLGLFGTVLGMIDAFAELEAGGGRVDPAALSGGIWEALLTTAVGLAVAIPTVAAANWFERRAERAERAAESALGAIFAAPPGADIAEEVDHAPALRAAAAV